ncbi:MAG: NUDIX domain-containing protein [Myxococcota bacterium]
MKVSAGLLMYRRNNGQLEMLIAHPGGPIYRRKDAGHWTIPKGLVDDQETFLAAAQREFSEETGFEVSADNFIELGAIRLASGKIVHGFAFEGDANPADLNSNSFDLEWPPHSGRFGAYPEVDEVRFVDPSEARRLLNPAQGPFVDRLQAALGAG